MTVLEKISAELKTAMLAKDPARTGALRMLKSAVGYAQIEQKNENLSDSEVLAVIQKEAKKRKDSIEEYEKGGRLDLAEKERAELGVLEGFLPRPLSVEELEALAKAAIASLGVSSKKEMGAVMKEVQSKAGGRADGKVLSGIVSRLLT
jgi:uncharacterized protein YqeY